MYGQFVGGFSLELNRNLADQIRCSVTDFIEVNISNSKTDKVVFEVEILTRGGARRILQ